MHVDEWPTGRVVLPTFGNKSRKTTKSYPSTGDQFWESRKTAKFDAPVGLLGRVSRSRSIYDSLQEAQWPYASFCQLSENRGKRQSPIRLRGISWGNENFCLNLFQQSSVPWYADRWVNGGSNKEPLARWGDEAFGDLNKLIVGEIEENDDKVRSVYGGSVEQAACRNLARSCAPKPGRVPEPGRRSHAETWPGRVRRSLVAFRSPAAGRMPKPGPVVCAEALPPVAFRSPAGRR